MAIIGIGVLGGAIYGIATADPYSEHSDYSNYGNYSNYSDAAERRRCRMEEKEAEIRLAVQDVNQYKINHVNAHLKDRSLIAEPGETVSLNAVEQDGKAKIDLEEKKKIVEDTSDIQREVDEIDAVIAAIDSVLEEKKQ